MEEKSLLKEIFNGEYDPFTNVMPNSPEYHEARMKRDAEWDFFLALIPEEHHERFDELMALFHTVSGYEAYEFYKEGVRAGFKLTNELSK